MAGDDQHNIPQPDEPESMPPSPESPSIDEPPVTDGDTQPRMSSVPPVSSPQGGDQPAQDQPPGAPVPPLETQAASLLAEPDDWARGRIPDQHEEEATSPGYARPLMLATVMFGTACLCLAMIGLAGFAGYRDGLATNDARVTQTLATGIAQQYATGAADLQAGYAELAAARFEWIVETIQAPTEYALDSPVQLAVARTIAAFTDTPMPTPSPTVTPTPPATDTLTPAPSPSGTATRDLAQDPAHIYEQALTAERLGRYEEAIEWLDALIALDPTYKRAEVQEKLVEVLTAQGRIYLLGMNEDGQDRLARGVYLIYRADEIGTVQPEWLLGHAIFVERYINARNYVNGGYYETAIPILEQLCAENCEWSYAGVSVSDLLERARAGS